MGDGTVSELQARLRVGDANAGDLLNAVCRRVARQVRSRLRLPSSDVDDIAQKTAGRALASIGDACDDPRRSFGAWLYLIALNVGRERAQERKRVGDGTAAIEAAERGARHGSPASVPLTAGRTIREALAEIPPDAPWMSTADRALCDAVLRHPGDRAAAAAAGLPRTTLRRRVADLARRAMARDSEDSGNLRGPPS
ncbi:MAG: hypothetical protein HMLKMBBP_03488 [Planctomycetes bacterium]|nr:hypothetical protein [Planctomycetota bacterium]